VKGKKEEERSDEETTNWPDYYQPYSAPPAIDSLFVVYYSNPSLSRVFQVIIILSRN
jgi:hypothetical protein